MTTGQIQNDVNDFRDRLIGLESAASIAMFETYSSLELALFQQYDAFLSANGSKLEMGDPSSVFRNDRYFVMMNEVDRLMNAYASAVMQIMTASEMASVRASFAEGAQRITNRGGPSLSAGFAGVPDSTVSNLVGALQQFTPVGQVLASYGPDVSRSIRDNLINGTGSGLSVDQIRRNIQQETTTLTRNRAETLIRTEILRASRVSLQTVYEQSGVVQGWRWSADLSSRTCPVCLALNGRIFPLREPMHSHVKCRCSPTPYLGDDTDEEWESGDSWLQRQPRNVQVDILGEEGYQLFNSGSVQLQDFIKIIDDPVWGRSFVNGGINYAIGQTRPIERPLFLGNGKPNLPTNLHVDISNHDLANALGVDFRDRHLVSNVRTSRISSHLDITTRNPFSVRSIERAADLIDNVIIDGRIPDIDISEFGFSFIRNNNEGIFSVRSNGTNPSIRFSKSAIGGVVPTIIHEIGHAVDTFGLFRGGSSRDMSSDSDKWLNLVTTYLNRTPLRLYTLVDSTLENTRDIYGMADIELWLDTLELDSNTDQFVEIYDYMYSPQEGFARMFTQYILSKNGEYKMIHDLEEETNGVLGMVTTELRRIDDPDSFDLYGYGFSQTVPLSLWGQIQDDMDDLFYSMGYLAEYD